MHLWCSKASERDEPHQCGIVKGRNEEWRKISRMKASRNGKLGLSERRGERSRPTLSSEKIKSVH